MGILSWLGSSVDNDEEDFDDGDSTFLGWVWSFFSNAESQRQAQDRIEKKVIELTKLVHEADRGTVLSTENDEIADEASFSDCMLRSGLITLLRGSSGCIDGNIHFDMRDAPLNLALNDRVRYMAFRANPDDDWIVRKVTAVASRRQDWDVEDRDFESQNEALDFEKIEDEPHDVETMYRSELRQVTGRSGREVIVNNGEFRFCLDEVTTLFTPIVGDFLYLDALVEVNEGACDFGGQIINISRIRWVRYKVVTSEVTMLDGEGGGVIGKDIFFNSNALKPGYAPCRGDVVNADAMESYQGICSWRALLVGPVAVRKNVRSNTKASNVEVEAMCTAKNGISLDSYEFSFGQVVKGERGKDVVVTLKNSGDVEQILMFADFHLVRKNSQVCPATNMNVATPIRPGQTVQYRFGCRGKFVGLSRELYVFSFKGFKIACNFELNVCDLESVQLITDDYGPGKRTVRDKRGFRRKMDENVVRGVRNVVPPKFIANRIDSFEVPRRFQDAFVNEKNEVHTTLVAEEMLQKIAPSLFTDLTFRNYRARFHALLYLEEIDATLKMEEYSMDMVPMSRAGQGGTFLSLEVPGLSEKRPSVLVGDKVHVSRPWEDERLVFEGFVHEIHGKYVWLKFNEDFHLSFNQAVVNVRFEFGRGVIRKQHAAIEIAMVNLGESILFPSKLSLQPPQVLLVENAAKVVDSNKLFVRHDTNKREISWINTSLNFYQKEAVRNVLKGEARPLPYVIFGPPGTGKTITLVETILQIFFLLPESRLLVATPSNSSANLIAERLLDSKTRGDKGKEESLLKPGDLVRLVSFHILDEGNISDKLRPYATTANIKEMSGEEAKADPIGQMRESANRNTLGRHRITVGTCMALGQLVVMGFPQGHFTHVIIDEAGQATEPEILVPLGFLDTTGQAILAGDPLQLGPVVGSRLASRFGLAESYLDRLIHRFPYQRDIEGFPDTAGHDPRLVTRLVENYRSLPEILALPNGLFYDSLLMPKVSPVSGPEADLLVKLGEFLPPRDASFGGPPPILFHGVVGSNLQDADSPSWFNPQETLVAMEYLTIAYESGLTPDDVGIITPYRKQVQKMRWYYNRLGFELPKIGSVEEFQGQERHVIILSAVRSNPKLIVDDVTHALGFVASPKRLNVAITRARTLLVIVGNPHVLATDPYWRSAIKYCLDRQCYTGCDPPMNCVSMSQVQDREPTSELQEPADNAGKEAEISAKLAESFGEKLGDVSEMLNG